MAKQKSTAQDDTLPTTAPATAKQRKHVVTAICSITGCGLLEAETRLKSMDNATITKIADLEAAGKRRDIIPILYA